MSTLKKILALSLALAMILSVSAFAGNYTVDTYQDVNAIDDGAAEAVEMLYALDIMVGNTNTATGKTEFRPNDTITREEVAKMIYVILNYGNDDKAEAYKASNIFADVTADSWAAGYINYLAAVGMVQGDGTNFYPKQAVKTAEVAKMLLTAIGYQAEDHGYVGADWSNNVLRDAYYIQLLDGYDATLNGNAPRQWVAVMFFNALTNAYTYDVTVPAGFTGYFGNYVNNTNNWILFGSKYLKLSSFDAVAYATENASVDTLTYKDEDKNTKTKKFANDYVLFDNGMEVKGTKLGAMDLGQTYRVIYKAGKTNVAYSVRSLYETAEARALDIDVDVSYDTYKNEASNKYEFTVDGVTAKFAKSTINVLYTGTTYQGEVENKTITVTEFYDLVNKPLASNDTYKVILNEYGKIQYIIVTEYDYAMVTKAATHNRYGDYVNVGNLSFNNQYNLYLDDCISTDDELVKGNVVKYTWNLDKSKFAMEVLPIVEDAVYSAIDKQVSPKLYTVGGEDYYIAEKALEKADAEKWFNNTKDNLDEEVCLVIDGDLIVYHWLSDSNYDNMDDINAQLVLVIDADDSYSTSTLREKHVIEYMTIDGKTHIAEYQDKDGYVPFYGTLMTKYTYNPETKLIDVTPGLELTETMTEEQLEGRLFILHEGSKDRVYLEELSTKKDEVNEQLNASTSLLNLYEIKADEKLDATGSAVKFGGDTMVSDNAFFYAYIDDGEAVFDVITPADFGKGYDNDAYGQVLSYVKAPSGRTTILGGYIVADLTSDTSSNFLYIEKIGKRTSDGQQLIVQVLGEDDTREIYVAEGEYYTDLLYSYTYKKMNDSWTLELVDKYTEADGEDEAGWNKGFWAERNVQWYDEDTYEMCLTYKRADKTTVLDVSDSDYVDYIVVTTIEFVRDETQYRNDDSYWLNEKDNLKSYSRELAVVDYKDLTAADVEDGNNTASYEQSSYWYYNAKAGVLYIVVLQDMTQAQ